MSLELENELKKIEYQNSSDKLGDSLSDIAEVTHTIEEDIAALKESIEMYTEMGCDLDQTLSSCAKVIDSKTWLKPFNKGRVSSANRRKYEFRKTKTRTTYSC